MKAIMEPIFGNGVDVETVNQILKNIGDEYLSQTPLIEVISDGLPEGINGAFDSLTGIIYLSQSFVRSNASNPTAITFVLLKEIGHYIDSKINSYDSPGDEGEIFARTVLNLGITEPEISKLKAEDATTTIILNNREVVVEQSTTTNLSTITSSPLGGSVAPNMLGNNEPISSKEIIEKLSSVKTVFTALGNTITQNPLFTQNVSLLPKRFDSNTATVFLTEVSDRVDKTLSTLANTPNLDFNTIVEQFSKSIESIGTLKVAIDGQLISPELIKTIKLGVNTEIVFNFDFSKLFTISETLAGNTSFEIAGTKTQATINGNANGSGTLGFNFSIGIDKVGKVFINEGGFLTSDIDLNATLAGNAAIKGLVNAGINGTGTLNLDAQLKIDDGDTILKERLYLSDDTALTFFAPNAASFTGGIVLDQATVKGSIPALSELELAIAASGSLDFVTGEAKLAVKQDALLDALVNATEKGISSLANQSAKIAQLTQNIPIVGDDLSTTLSSTIKKGLGFDAPDKGTKAYLESLGITVEKSITPEQFFSGNFLTSDALLLRYNSSIRDTFQLLNAAGNLDVGVAKFTVNGNLQANPNLAFDIRFGLDLVNGPFMLEGGIIDAKLPITGNFNGSASIGKLLKGDVNISNATLNPEAKLTFSDFDNVANERFYLLGSNNTLSLETILGKKEAIALTGNLALDAALTAANPAENLNIPLLKSLNLGSFTWNASVQYDLVTGKADYTIKNDARITAIANLFQGKQGDIINLFLEDLVGSSNPIPKEIRTILTQEIPLLGKNLLDIIGVPKGLQILIEPEKFKGKSIEQINDKTGLRENDILDLSFNLVKTDNILKLLSGQDIDVISLDVKQTLASFEKKIKVLPSTTVFTFYGIAGISAGVDIEASLSMLLDTTIGFDTQGFYVIENGAKAPSGRTVGNTLFSLNPTITGILTGTLDLITVLDLIDIAGRVSLIGQLGLRLDDSPSGVDSDPKVRLAGLNDTNLYPTLKLDLGFGLTSTLLPVGNLGLPLIKKGELEKSVPLYNKSAGSLADIKNDVKSFVDKTRAEGGLKVYALGLITGSPTLLTAGTALFATSPQVTQAFSELATGLKESGRDMLGAAKSIAEVVKEYSLDLGQTAKFLYQEFSGGVAGVANALYNGVTKNIGDIAKGLYKGVTQNLGSIAGGLYNGVTKNIGSVAKGLYDGVTTNLGSVAKGLYDGVTTNLGSVAKGLYDGVTTNLGSVAKGLYDGVTTNLGSVARGLYNGVTTSLDSIAKGLYDGVTQDLTKIAKAIIGEFGTGFSFILGNLITRFLPDGSKIQEFFDGAGKLLKKVEFFNDGVSEKVRSFYSNGVRIAQDVFRSAGNLAEKIEYFGDGVSYKVRTFYSNGVRTAQNIWRSAGDFAEAIEFFGDGVSYKVRTFYSKGVRTAQNIWRSAGDFAEAIEFFGDGVSYKVRTFYSKGVRTAQNIWRSAGDFAEAIEFFGDGVSYKVRTFYSKGVRTAQDVFGSAGKLAEKIEFFADGVSYKVRNFYSNGVNTARNIWRSPGDLAQVIEWSGNVTKVFDYAGGKLNKYSEFVGGTLEKYWDSVKGWWDSAKGWWNAIKPRWWPF
jgi:hypothetical protein